MAEDLYAHLRSRGDVGWDEVMQTPSGVAGAEPGTFRDLTRSILFGDVWQRPHLTRRERRLIVLALTAVYGRDEPLFNHVHGALVSGDLDIDALDELTIFLAFYAGWPVGSTLHGATRRAEEAGTGPDPDAGPQHG